MKRQHKSKSFDQLPCPSHGMEILDITFIKKAAGRNELQEPESLNEELANDIYKKCPFENISVYENSLYCP